MKIYIDVVKFNIYFYLLCVMGCKKYTEKNLYRNCDMLAMLARAKRDSIYMKYGVQLFKQFFK